MIGGIVRSTGSGMGCPDWPKCFGRLIPPTSAEELPSDYQSYYSTYRHKKNLRFAKLLDLLGYKAEAKQLRHDERILVEEPFNVSKTWVEYLNRVVGAVVGLAVLATCIYSLYFWSKNRWWSFFGVFLLFTTLLEGWIGSVVVSTNLVSWMIDVHIYLALAILALHIMLIDSLRNSRKSWNLEGKQVFCLACLALILLLIQINLGTNVRTQVDEHITAIRANNYESLDLALLDLFIHRGVGWLLAGIVALLVFILFQKGKELRKVAFALGGTVFFEILAGIMLDKMNIPRWLQPIHLLLATMIFGLLFYIVLISFRQINWKYK